MTPEQLAAALALAQTNLVAAQKRLAAVEGLTGPQLDLYRTLNEGGREALLAMGVGARDVEVAKAQEADKIEVDLGDGMVVRKSAGPIAVMLAKSLKDSRDREAASQVVAQMAVYKARVATDLGGLPLDEAQGVALLVAIDGIKPDLREKVVAAIKAKSADFSKGGRVFGVVAGSKAKVEKSAAGEGLTPDQQFVVNVRKFAADNKIERLSDAYVAYEQTEEGRALLVERDEAHRQANGG